ncbi:MAG: hypothetical protein H0X39_17000 [Actinobacteria bacterium]|nr:hypothetical protein [Actinomycetota bacterium]
MPATWLLALSRVVLAAAFLCIGLIATDVFVRGYRQRMPIMEAVWPVSALYSGPLATWAYRRWGRPQSPRWLEAHGLEQPPEKSPWATYAVGVSHCGAGCTLGDIVAEFIDRAHRLVEGGTRGQSLGAG